MPFKGKNKPPCRLGLALSKIAAQRVTMSLNCNRLVAFALVVAVEASWPSFSAAAESLLECTRIQDPSVAIIGCTRALKSKKLNKLERSMVHLNRGFAYQSNGNYAIAIQDYDTAIELNPKAADLYVSRGVAYGIQEQYDEAIANFDKAIELEPDNAEAYINRGNAYDFRGQHDRAVDDYSMAIKLNPNDVDAYVNRGVTYRTMGQRDKAMADFRKAIEIMPAVLGTER